MRVTRPQPRAGGGRRCTCCRSSGSATPGAWKRQTRRSRGSRGRRVGERRRSSTPDAGHVPPVLRRHAEAAVLRQRDQRRAACTVECDAPRLLQGRLSRVRRRRQSRDAVNPAATGTKAAALYRARACRRGGPVAAAAAPRAIARRRQAVRATSTPIFAAAPQRGRRVLRRAAARASPSADARHVQRQAFAGMIWSKQFFYYDVPEWLKGDPAQPPPPPERRSAAATASGRTSTTPTSSRCRTSGSTRGTPPGTSPSTAFPLALVDPEFAKDQLVLLTREWYMHPNGQLPGLRVGLRRRQPAGARLGGVARLPDRPQAAAAATRRPRLPRARLPQADAELHLVGEPQGRRGPQRLPGRLPRPRQHRRLRPQRAAADRRLHRPGRRHQLDGDVLPEPACASRWSWRCTTRSTRTSRPSSSSTSCTSPRR